MQDYQLLAWDSDLLGFGVAKLLPATFTEPKLRQVLTELKSQQITLVYWASDSQDQDSQQAAESCDGVLADRKVTYHIDFVKGYNPEYDASLIEEYPIKTPNEELEALAIESGLFSRFNQDPKFTRARFEKVYKLWLYNSTTRKVAETVLVIKRDTKIVAMVTLGEKNSRGDIGLLAVDPNYRGQHLGSTLVKAAQDWFIRRGYPSSQVVTQQDNVAASALYEKCGYKIEKIENFYHLWLD